MTRRRRSCESESHRYGAKSVQELAVGRLGAHRRRKGTFAVKEDVCKAAGIDYAKGLERFMGNEALYLEFMSKFLYDSSFQEFWAGIEMGDLSMAEKSIDTLRGTAANLSMVSLSALAEAIGKELRAGKSMEEIQPLIYEVREVHQKICDAIRKNFSA
jgi:putative hybrid sensory kinase